MTKSTSYWETFRRHRFLLSAPIILAVIVAGWSVFGAAKSYMSTANLWVSYPPRAKTLLAEGTPPPVSPSDQEQALLQELLATRSFALAVGHNSQLATYLSTHGSAGWSPTALLSGLGGGGASVNSRIISALGPKAVTSSTPGPQVLQINLAGPSPAVAASALGAVVRELQQNSTRYKVVNTVQVVDPPAAGGPSKSHKKELMAILGGIFAGVLISFLGTVALTKSKADPWEQGQAELWDTSDDDLWEHASVAANGTNGSNGSNGSNGTNGTNGTNEPNVGHVLPDLTSTDPPGRESLRVTVVGRSSHQPTTLPDEPSVPDEDLP